MAGKHNAKRGQFYDIWRAMMSNRVTVICLIIAFALINIAIFADVLFDYDNVVIKQDVINRLKSPSSEHWFGTDIVGRDYFSRVLYATRYSLLIGFCAAAGGAVCGIIIGSVSAYYGGKVDAIIQRILDVIISIPQLLLIICVMAVMGGGAKNIIIAFIFTGTPAFSRTVRAAMMVAAQNEYVEAAKALGARDLRIILTHLLPNSLGPTIVHGTMAIASCILSTAGLGYLGMGVAAPTPEWGQMLSDAQQYMRAQPYLILFPGAFILITAMTFNLLGDGLRDAMDPRLRGFRKEKKNLFRRQSKNDR